jgi:hypothetical protein
VIALAAATPMAAASGSGSIVMTFLFAGDFESNETTLAGFISIKNDSTTDYLAQDVEAVIEWEEHASYITAELPSEAEADGDLGEAVVNDSFDVTASSPGTLTLATTSPVDIMHGDTIYIAFFFRRAAHNPVTFRFVIAGRVKIGPGGATFDGAIPETGADVEPAAG